MAPGSKVALITGASTGIGFSTALWLAGRNHRIGISYLKSRVEAERCVKVCEALGAKAIAMQADVRNASNCQELVDAVTGEWGQLDVLINNAGATVFTGLDNWDALSAEVFHSIYAVNAMAAFEMTRASAPWLRASRGCVVNVSSAGAVLGRGSSVPYLMSKGALNSLTLYLARALAPDVRVNAVCPGLVTTDWFREGLGDEGYEELRKAYEDRVALARANTPEDVAGAIGWLIEGARTMTGELLMLDSGLHLG